MTVLPFAFGKLPSHGDFVSRGLAPAERDAWDAFASDGLAKAQAALGPQFEEAYAAAPPWRFAFGPGPFGAGWRAGAFAPSVDRAGRRFPLIVGLSGPELVGVDVRAVAEAAESAIYGAFEAAESVDALHDRLAAIKLEAVEAPPQPGFWTLGGERHAPCALADDQPHPSLLVRALTPDPAEAFA